MDASQRTTEGEVALIPFAQQEPLLPVYGELTTDPTVAAAGHPFEPSERGVVLEPGEHVDTDLAFPLRSAEPRLLAMRVTVVGTQGTLRRRAFEWATFFFIDPESNGLPAVPPDPTARR
jgi:hypothetical protein